MSPLKALYGYNPPHMSFHTYANYTYVAVVEDYMKKKHSMLYLLKKSLHKAQERMKFFADKLRINRSFGVANMVYMKLHPYRQASMAFRKK